MAKDKDRPNLPPGWRFDPPTDDMYASNATRKDVPYIQLPQDAMPLLPFTHIVIAYLVAKQINAFLRAL